jgi:hypothetical protein
MLTPTSNHATLNFMIVEHYGIKVDIPAPKFGNERDIYIRDAMEELYKAIKNKAKMPEEKKKEKVKTIMLLLKQLSQQL